MKLPSNYSIFNTAENIAIVAITYFFLNFTVMTPLNKRIDTLEGHLAKIAMQPKYAIQNDFEKMRTKKSGSIVLDLNNELTHTAYAEPDSVSVLEETAKRGLLKRIFKNKK